MPPIAGVGDIGSTLRGSGGITLDLANGSQRLDCAGMLGGCAVVFYLLG